MKKTVREWMQTEVWSKRTTKKIVFIVVILFAIASGFIVIFDSWINPWERNAARVMFENAVAVRKASAEDLKSKLEVAKASEDLAEARTWTLRDERVEVAVSGLILEAEICRKYELSPSVLPGMSGFRGDKELGEQDSAMGKMACNLYDIGEFNARHVLSTRLGF